MLYRKINPELLTGDIMEDKTICLKCHKINDIQKFCIYCGARLPVNDEEIRLAHDNPKPYCLNCGRPVEKGQSDCVCGYHFGDIKCPECNTENKYENMFCTSCGERLWNTKIFEYRYMGRLFENHLINETIPLALQNTSIYRRNMKPSVWLGENTYHYDDNPEKLKTEDPDIDKNLSEICSRWRIVSPSHCISCFKIQSDICSCMMPFVSDERIEFLKSEKNYYIEPKFDVEELKWTSKYKRESYLRSLAPSIGESQLEYRERLKWEYAANINRKKKIRNVLNSINRKNTRTGKATIEFTPPPYFDDWDDYRVTYDEWMEMQR